jgi:Protein of unknown function (DUF2934)
MSTSRVTTTRSTRRKSPVPMVPPAKPATASGLISAMSAEPVRRKPVDPESRRLMIAEAAYYCAEKRGFAPGGEMQDWLEAEAQLKAILGE